MPETIWAEMRDGSRVTWYSANPTKPSTEIRVKTQLPRPTRACVRTPADLCWKWRSIPTSVHSTKARETSAISIGTLLQSNSMKNPPRAPRQAVAA